MIAGLPSAARTNSERPEMGNVFWCRERYTFQGFRRLAARAPTPPPLCVRAGPRPFAAAAPPPRRLCGVAAVRALANPFYPPFCAPPPCHRVPGGAHCPRRSPSSRTTTTVTDTPPSAAVPVGTVTDAAQAPEGGTMFLFGDVSACLRLVHGFRQYCAIF